MDGKFPTANHVADTLKNHLERISGPLWPIVSRGMIQQQGWAADKLGPGMDIRAFDMTLADGRVYRVRVSDITPEKVKA